MCKSFYSPKLCWKWTFASRSKFLVKPAIYSHFDRFSLKVKVNIDFHYTLDMIHDYFVCYFPWKCREDLISNGGMFKSFLQSLSLCISIDCTYKKIIVVFEYVFILRTTRDQRKTKTCLNWIHSHNNVLLQIVFMCLSSMLCKRKVIVFFFLLSKSLLILKYNYNYCIRVWNEI